ncbi:MAG: HXXEE domain-containing protein [Rhodothermales bacterium]
MPARTVVLWLPMIAIAAHLFEEFVWPGGFKKWYQRYPPGRTVPVTARFLLIMNAVFVALAALPPVLGPTPRGFAFWMVVAALAAANGVFHVVATLRTRAYAHRRGAIPQGTI